jgi:hypothetical protein
LATYYTPDQLAMYQTYLQQQQQQQQQQEQQQIPQQTADVQQQGQFPSTGAATVTTPTEEDMSVDMDIGTETIASTTASNIGSISTVSGDNDEVIMEEAQPAYTDFDSSAAQKQKELADKLKLKLMQQRLREKLSQARGVKEKRGKSRLA